MICPAQLIGANNCGQIAVALVTGTNLSEVSAAVGHDSRTTTKELIQGIRKLGWDTPARLSPRVEVERGIAKYRLRKNGAWQRNWHWVAVMNGQVYDGQRFREGMTILNFLEEEGRLSSFLPVRSA